MTTDRETRKRRAAHVAFAVATLALVGAYALTDGAARSLVFLCSTLAPAVALVVTLLVRRPPRPQVWWCAAAALTLLTVDNVAWLVQVGLGGAVRATGLIPVVTVPLGYLLLLLASILVVVPTARTDGGQIVDATIMALGSAGVLWSAALFPSLAARDAGLGERAYTLVTVMLVSGITGAMVRALVAVPEARASIGYLLLAGLCALAGNVGNVVTVDPVTGAAAHWVGGLWIVAYTATGSAAVHPASRFVATAERRTARRLTPGHLTFLGVALALNPTLAGIRELTGRGSDVVLLSIETLLLVPLVLVRVSQLAILHARAEQELLHQATHDSLTGLPNRRTVDARVRTAVADVREGRTPAALVCFLDLDDFKDVNDRHGHHTGDRLLVEVGRRLRAAVDAGDLVARFGGDEFVLVRTGDPAALEADTLDRVGRALAEPVDLGTWETRARASLGTTLVVPSSTRTAEEILSDADARMYAQKRSRRPRDTAPSQDAVAPRDAVAQAGAETPT